MSKANPHSDKNKKKMDKRRLFVSILAGIMIFCMVLPMITMIFEFM